MQTSCSSKCRLLMVAFPIHWQLWGLLLTVSLSILVHLRWLQSVLQVAPRCSSGSDGREAERADVRTQTYCCCLLVFVNALVKISVLIRDTLFHTMLHHVRTWPVTVTPHFDRLWPTLSDFDQGTRVDRRLWHHALPIGDGKSPTHTSQGRQPLQRRQESSSLRNQRLNDNKSTKLVQTSSIEQCWAASPKMSKDFVSSVFEGFL